MALIERKVVMRGKTENGDTTIDLPVTALENIEDTADVKDTPADNDYIPIIDSGNSSQMKKTLWSSIKAALAGVFAAKSHSHDDRYYTETETNSLLSGKAASSHTHTAAQVSGLPTSLPANGGNADTVDGKHAASFAAASHTHDDRYYTETEVSNLLNGKAASSHGHTAAQISGLPTSLPANGGNSDTVDSVHVVTTAALGLHRLASGTAAANTTNCPVGAWYGQHS